MRRDPLEAALPPAYRLEGSARGPWQPQPPRNVFIEVTNRCNLACETCVRSFLAYEPPHDLTMDEFTALAEQFPQMQRAVLHGVGEPLLNPALSEMVRWLKGRGVHVLFNSNGTLLTPQLQEELISSGLDEFRLSLDGADAPAYQRIHGRPLFDRVVANMTQFSAAIRRRQSVTPRLSLWCVGMRENLAQWPGLIRLAAQVGIPEVYVQRLTYFLDQEERHGLGQAEQALFGAMTDDECAALQQCEELARRLGVAFMASGATDPRSSLEAASSCGPRPWSECRRPWTTAYVTANGNALPCCMAHWATTQYRELILGHGRERPFERIWNDEPYRRWREALLSDAPPRACQGCGVCWSL